jgi:pimeloyl-ACP methyl ester carboxylesterase
MRPFLALALIAAPAPLLAAVVEAPAPALRLSSPALAAPALNGGMIGLAIPSLVPAPSLAPALAPSMTAAPASAASAAAPSAAASAVAALPAAAAFEAAPASPSGAISAAAATPAAAAAAPRGAPVSARELAAAPRTLDGAAFDGGAFKGFIAIGGGKELYVDYTPPKPGKPTLVVLNGLTYDVDSWQQMMPELQRPGNGLLRLDPMGQGRTLAHHGPADRPIEIEDQAHDLATLLDRMNIRERVQVLGLSYGGGWAMAFAAAHPEKVDHVILMAPFIAPLPDQDGMLKIAVSLTRLMFPFNPASDEEIYEYFLKNIVYMTYPLAEPVILKHPYRLEAVFRLVQHLRTMDVSKLVDRLTDQKIHLIVADGDKVVPRSILDGFWDGLARRFKGSRLNIDRAEHKIPETTPNFAAGWINQILEGRAELEQGRTFEGAARQGRAVATDATVLLPHD